MVKPHVFNDASPNNFVFWITFSLTRVSVDILGLNSSRYSAAMGKTLHTLRKRQVGTHFKPHVHRIKWKYNVVYFLFRFYIHPFLTMAFLYIFTSKTAGNTGEK